MMFRMFQFGSFLLIVWLTFQLSSQGAALSVIQSQQQRGTAFNTLSAKQDETTQKLTKLEQDFATVIGKQLQNTQYKKQLDDYRKQQRKTNLLKQAYILVLEAEAARATGNAQQAMSKLKASKKPIWQSGDNFPKNKKQLQSLMQTIDATLAAWKNKNLKQNTQKIYSTVAKVLQTQGALK